ncbi:T9SS-dependent choice-of-anchor J family protein [Gaetbulibacter jejuensis]|uniref:Fibronectin type-III domain-containing protein n=1 Tax=Gaetbulibacter jejuensis TaxID=584607 RepID=A0ABN1JUC0_9FLAO
MKKITLLIALAIFSFCWQSNAQISEDFEVDPPSGWTFMQTEGDDPGFVQTSSRANSGTYSFYHNDDNIATESTSWMISPSYTVSTGDVLEFYYNHNYTSIGYGVEEGIWISTTSADPINNPGDFTLLYDLLANASEDVWTLYSQSLDAYAGQTVYFAFKYVGDWEDELYIDDFFAGAPPTCLEPSAMTANNITSTSADLSWTLGDAESMWNLEWKAGADFNPGAGEEDGSDSVSGSPEYNSQLTGLTANTEYYVYYQADCGGGDTSTWASFTFTTLAETPNCAEAPITPLDAAVDVEGETVSLSWTAPSSGPTPTGYNIYSYDDATGTNPVLETTVATTTASVDFSYSQVVYWSAVPVNVSVEASGCAIWSFTIEGAPIGYDCSNPIVVSSVPYSTSDDTANYGDAYDPSDVPALTGAQYTNGTGSSSYLGSNDAVYSFTPASDGVYSFDLTLPTSDWHSLWLFEGCPFSSVVAYHTSTSGSTRSLPLISLTSGTTYYVVVSAWTSYPQTSTYDLDIYEVTCPAPSGMTADNLTETSTDLSWSAGYAETTWNIEWKEGADFTPAMGEEDGSDTVSGTPEYNGMLTGLNESTTYYVYYQADCGGETSDWVAFTFTTPAAPPANDECLGAIELTVEGEIADLPSATQIPGTIAGATDSGIAAPTGTANDDVWYSFTATATDINIDVTDDFDGVIQLFSGDCNNLTSIEYDDYDSTYGNPRISRTDFVVGQTYYVRVYYYYSGTPTSSDFTIALWSTSEVLSVGDVEENSQFTYFPNPVNDKLTLNAQSNIQNVAVYNILGQEVINASPNTLDAEVDMVNLNSGAYFVKVTIDNATKTIRVIKN